MIMCEIKQLHVNKSKYTLNWPHIHKEWLERWHLIEKLRHTTTSTRPFQLGQNLSIPNKKAMTRSIFYLGLQVNNQIKCDVYSNQKPQVTRDKRNNY